MIIAIKGLSRHKGPADASSTNRLSRTTRQTLRSRPHALSAKIHPRDSGFIGETCTTTNGHSTPKDSVRRSRCELRRVGLYRKGNGGASCIAFHSTAEFDPPPPLAIFLPTD